MKFLQKNICEKLVELGCVSESGYFYWLIDKKAVNIKPKDFFKHYATPAFTLSDFVETEDYAEENCKRIWPQKYNEGIPCPDNISGCLVFHYKTIEIWHEKQHALIDSHDWIEFLTKAVEGR